MRQPTANVLRSISAWVQFSRDSSCAVVFRTGVLGVVKYPLDLLSVNGLVRDISYRERLYVAALEVKRSELRAQRAVVQIFMVVQGAEKQDEFDNGAGNHA